LNAYLFPPEESSGRRTGFVAAGRAGHPARRPVALRRSARQHRVLCADSTSPEAVSRLLGERKPFLMVTDPPYGIELDSEWRDRAGLNGCGPAEASYMKQRTTGHTETSISGDTRADWSEAFALVPESRVAYVWHASKFTREVLDGLLRIGFLHHQQIHLEQGAHGAHAHTLLVPA